MIRALRADLRDFEFWAIDSDGADAPPLCDGQLDPFGRTAICPRHHNIGQCSNGTRRDLSIQVETALDLPKRMDAAPSTQDPGLSTICDQTLRGCLRPLLFFLMMLALPALLSAETLSGRFFLMGDGRLHIKNMHTGMEASVNLINPDGSMNEAGFCRIDEVFGFPTKEKGEHISPRLLFMLDYFSDQVAPGKAINMVSGYRSPEHNSSLRNTGGNVAKTSIHMDGMALDFSIEGVDGKYLWRTVKDKNCCGIGHYGGAAVHLDAAKPRFWEAATSKVRTGESDHNQRIHLSTDYDRYQAGDNVRLSFASVSDFGFGMKRTVALVHASDGNHTVATAQIKAPGETECFILADRKASHFIHFPLPEGLREGNRFRVRVDFCRRPSERMPSKTLSNEIELREHIP